MLSQNSRWIIGEQARTAPQESKRVHFFYSDSMDLITLLLQFGSPLPALLLYIPIEQHRK